MIPGLLLTIQIGCGLSAWKTVGVKISFQRRLRGKDGDDDKNQLNRHNDNAGIAYGTHAFPQQKKHGCRRQGQEYKPQDKPQLSKIPVGKIPGLPAFHGHGSAIAVRAVYIFWGVVHKMPAEDNHCQGHQQNNCQHEQPIAQSHHLLK